MLALVLLLSVLAGAQAPYVLPPDRATAWRPGVPGGVPNRTQVCATVPIPSGDAVAAIQTAINGCPAGQVVQLVAGQYTLSSNGYIAINKGVTLRGAGGGVTRLVRTNGAKPGSYQPGVAVPIAILGPSRWSSGGTSFALAADAPKGATSVRLSTAPTTFTAGQIVLLDELSGAQWMTDPGNRGQIWASPDWRVVWQRHNPSLGTDDPWPAANEWFSRADRPQNEIKEVASYDATSKTITFTTPLHTDYRASHTAQIYVYASQDTHVKGAGIEDLSASGGDDGQIRFNFCNACWAARVENSAWLGEGFAIDSSFRVTIRDSYVHDAVWPSPGGGGYAVSSSMGSSEWLLENNIIRKANKVMVARSSGSGSVVGYNYVDDGYILGQTDWVEIGLNASHMVGPHHVLFEGNQGFNFDSDKTHGNSTYMTVFRNWLTGKRSGFTDGGPKRAAGAAFYGYWMSYVGNVLGTSGMTGWQYESTNMNTPGIFLLGWDDWSPYPADPKVKATALREGNFDYITNGVKWDTTAATLPDSMYLSGKPAFFGGAQWPWVDPLGATKVFTLPAKARYDSGSPLVPPTGGDPTPVPNQPPVVSSGGNQTITLPATATLSGTVSDDGLPAGATVTSAWTKISGPGTVTFASATTPATTATFSAAGSYVLRLTATDTALSASSDTTVTVSSQVPVNVAPIVSAGANQTITLPAAATLIGSVKDDGLPTGATVLSAWSTVSGPGSVTFANPTNATTTATFSMAGSYVLRLTASDTALSSNSTTTVTVNAVTPPPTPVPAAVCTYVAPTTTITARTDAQCAASGLKLGCQQTVTTFGSATCSVGVR